VLRALKDFLERRCPWPRRDRQNDQAGPAIGGSNLVRVQFISGDDFVLVAKRRYREIGTHDNPQLVSGVGG
jgi:hypothetical protein